MLIEYIRLLRPSQWYKNLLIFAVPFFGRQMLYPQVFMSALFGFFCLCMVSSANYIINDIIDRDKDRHNLEKRSRPIARGTVPVVHGWVLAFVLLAVAGAFSFYLNPQFFYFVIALFASTCLYTVWLKHEVIADILAISINFLLRATSGYPFVHAHAVNINLSQWFLVCVFFLSVVLAAGKRYSEYRYLEEQRRKHRRVYGVYSEEVLRGMFLASLVCLLMSVSIFPFFSLFAQKVVYLTPLAVYICFRYMYLVQSGSMIGRHPQLMYKDIRSTVALGFYAVIAFVLIYFV